MSCSTLARMQWIVKKSGKNWKWKLLRKKRARNCNSTHSITYRHWRCTIFIHLHKRAFTMYPLSPSHAYACTIYQWLKWEWWEISSLRYQNGERVTLRLTINSMLKMFRSAPDWNRFLCFFASFNCNRWHSCMVAVAAAWQVHDQLKRVYLSYIDV
jgi:hypothetical protein